MRPLLKGMLTPLPRPLPHALHIGRSQRAHQQRGSVVHASLQRARAEMLACLVSQVFPTWDKGAEYAYPDTPCELTSSHFGCVFAGWRVDV
jgi:hypothetical protein